MSRARIIKAAEQSHQTEVQQTAIDLFSGSGAVTTALVRAGFKVLAAVDNDPIACETYRLNHPDVKLLQRDIKKLTKAQILTLRPIHTTLDILVVCAPCQPFSSQNRKRGSDSRSLLLLQCVRFAKALQPKCIVIENVPGLTTDSHKGILTCLGRRLLAIGYTLSAPRRIDAADLGVPQRRIRCLIVATKKPHAVSFFENASLNRPKRTVRQAIGHLPSLVSGQFCANDKLHRARLHRPVALERLNAIPKDGGSRSSLPNHLVLKCHREKDSFPDVYGRMSWDSVAPTLTTGCDDVTRGRFAHPDQDRAITLREAALLQTFPADYQFSGNRRQIARQIGNAVPVTMFESLVPILRSMATF